MGFSERVAAVVSDDPKLNHELMRRLLSIGWEVAAFSRVEAAADWIVRHVKDGLFALVTSLHVNPDRMNDGHQLVKFLRDEETKVSATHHLAIICDRFPLDADFYGEADVLITVSDDGPTLVVDRQSESFVWAA